MDRVYGGFAGLQNPKVNTDLFERRDAVNLKLYGTTDVHILTDDDIWITEDGIFEAQKVERIDYEVVIIPHGVRHIIPKTPDYDEDSCEHFYEEGVYPIWINAKKIICPNTLVNIYASLNQDVFSFCNIQASGDFVLNDGVQIINLFDEVDADNATELGDITIPKTLKSFTVWDYNHDITIPHNVDKFSFWCAGELNGDLYVHNPNFDFSGFEVGFAYEDDTGSGTIYGYAGSTAETFAKENGYTFKNLGSAGGVTADELNDWVGAFNARLDNMAQEYISVYDFQNIIGDIETALDSRIIEIQDELLGGDAE